MGKKDKGDAQVHEGDADQAGQDAAVAQKQAGQEPVFATDGEDGEDFAKDHPAAASNVLDQRTAGDNHDGRQAAVQELRTDNVLRRNDQRGGRDGNEALTDEETVPSTTAAVDGEGAATGTEAAAGIDATTGTAEGDAVSGAAAGSAAAGSSAVGGDDGGDGSAGGGSAADVGAALDPAFDPDGDPAGPKSPPIGAADPLATLNETDGFEAPVECDVRGDRLLTLDDLLEQAREIMQPAWHCFCRVKPSLPQFVMGTPEKGETNPAKVLADFYVANPDAPLQAGFQQLRLKGFGSLPGAETNPAALWQFSVFRAVIDGGLAFMRAEQKELADALAAGKKPETWGGATGFKPEPGPFEPTGFTAE